MMFPGKAIAGGRYRVLSLIWRSPNAEVWRAIDIRGGIEVAVKAIPVAVGGAVAAEQEAEAAVRVRHPGVISIVETLADETHGYIVMDLAVRSLADHVRLAGPLDGPQTWQLAQAIADVLAVAHRAGVVHRDLKPQNVLVMADGTIRVADFGIARVLTGGHTRSGVFLGTLPFMPPEQRHDPRAVSPATDVYALGVMLAWARTEALPGDLFVPEAQDALRVQLASVGESDDELLELVLACGRYSAEERPQDGAAVQAWLQGRGTLAPLHLVMQAPPVPAAPERAPGEPADAPGGSTRSPQNSRQFGLVVALVGLVAAGLGRWTAAPRGDVQPNSVPNGESLNGDSLAMDPESLQAYLAWNALPVCVDGEHPKVWRNFPARMEDVPTFREATGSAVGDIDGDGYVDLVFVHQLDKVVLAFWGPFDANSWFPAQSSFSAPRIAGRPTLADFDGDGNVDIAAVLAEGMGVQVQRMAGRVPVGEPIAVAQGTEPTSLGATDWDADGRADLAIRLSTGSVVVRRSEGGDFAPPVVIAADADFVTASRDGRVWAVLDDELQVLQNRAPVARYALPAGFRVTSMLPEAASVFLHGESPAGRAMLHVQGDGSMCRYPRAVWWPSSVADLDEDGLLDWAYFQTCSYCTSSYHVGLTR